MGKFEKVIHYLDLYENNEKSGAAGCAEIITRGDTISLKVSIHTQRQTNQLPIKIYGVQNTASQCKLKELVRGKMNQEGFSFMKRYREGDEELQYLSGLYAAINHRIHIIGIWNKAEEVFRHYPKILQEEERQMQSGEELIAGVRPGFSERTQNGGYETKENETGKIEAGWNEVCKNEAGKNKADKNGTGQKEAEENRAGKNETEKNEIKKNAADKNPIEKGEKKRKTQEKEESQNGRDNAEIQGEMAKKAERQTEIHTTSQKNDRAEEDIPYGEDKWTWLCKKYKVIHPFSNQGDYIMIAPRDLLFLPSQYQKLVNNSFLLHGYYNYRHLILGKYRVRRVEKFYLGVPGNYYTREQMVADMFGFEGFEKSGTGETAQGSFGYYMKEVEL